jgi:hypothetical protein
MSPQMTAVYARLLDDTKREHWLKAVKINAAGRPASISAGHPLADATWAKLSMVRAKVTLPNGYCGAPVQTDCEFANPCLDCKFFITTADFLDQHRRQREETGQMIADAEQAGLRRVVEKNTRTLTKLTKIIDALESAEQGQIVVGGQVEDLDATRLTTHDSCWKLPNVAAPRHASALKKPSSVRPRAANRSQLSALRKRPRCRGRGYTPSPT